MATVDVSKAKSELEGEREKLVRQLAELGATETGDLTGEVEFGDGFADAGAATAERTELLGVVESLKTQVDAIEAALGRIESGDYGSCARCGKEIGAARLEARPASILCVDCKSRR